MSCVYLWPVCAVLTLVVVEGQQDELPLPEILKVYPDGDDIRDFGVWKMNVEWRDHLINSRLQKVTCDIEIYHHEQMRLVYNETVEVTTNETQQWSWTSPLPLQCTSHSVRLRTRDSHHTSGWTPFFILKGADVDDVAESKVYPQEHVVRVGDSITLCCILKAETLAGFSSSTFNIRISNRTYVSKLIRSDESSSTGGYNINCDVSAIDGTATYFTGYPPDDQDLTCETRDLSSVECHWRTGRNTGEAVVVRTHYTINKRNCKDVNKCVVDESIDGGVKNWTLIAKNTLGIKTISDRADPKHRVRLKAPQLAPVTVAHARTARLEWKWAKMPKYDSFPMTCRVEVNGLIVKEMFNGTGLKSLLLADLQPFTQYTARVQCAGSGESFYKWGDWSDLISFSTKEDVPEALDVWMQVYNRNTYVVWNTLSLSQSHGIITGYELLVNRVNIRRAADEQCYKLSLHTADHFISVSARNSAGVSPPSSISISSLWSETGINSTAIKGHDDQFNISWDLSSSSSCGYVVDWFPTFKAKPCALQWKKIPSNVSSATIVSDFEKGVKYTLSVYTCTSGAPKLLQRRHGYVEELAPSGKVHNLKAEQRGSDVKLSWEDVPEEQQNGVILGYIVSYKLSSGDETGKSDNFIEEASVQSREYSISNLRSGSYTFTVKAFTSAGSGPESKISQYIDLEVYKLIISILAALGTVACALAIIILCSIKREWLKSKLYPDIPKPVLTDSWLTQGLPKLTVIDKLLQAESEVLMVKNPEACLQVVPEVRKHEELHLDSKERNTYYNDVRESETVSPISLDSSYIETPCTGIQNPTYNLQLTDTLHTDVVLDYMPQSQTVNNQHSEVTLIEMDYQPQARVTLNTAEKPEEFNLPLISPSDSSSAYLLHSACR